MASLVVSTLMLRRLLASSKLPVKPRRQAPAAVAAAATVVSHAEEEGAQAPAPLARLSATFQKKVSTRRVKKPFARACHAAHVIALLLSFALKLRKYKFDVRASMGDRMAIASILSENESKGAGRLVEDEVKERVAAVEAKLDRYRPVLSALTAGINPELSLSDWGGAECAQLVANLKLPRYAEAFGRNLTGPKLKGLKIAHLPQLGVTPFEHQKAVLRGLEQLHRALAAKVEEQNVRTSWTGLSIARDHALRARAQSPAPGGAQGAQGARAPPPPPPVPLWPRGFGRAMQEQRAAAKQMHPNFKTTPPPRTRTTVRMGQAQQAQQVQQVQQVQQQYQQQAMGAAEHMLSAPAYALAPAPPSPASPAARSGAPGAITVPFGGYAPIADDGPTHAMPAPPHNTPARPMSARYSSPSPRQPAGPQRPTSARASAARFAESPRERRVLEAVESEHHHLGGMGGGMGGNEWAAAEGSPWDYQADYLQAEASPLDYSLNVRRLLPKDPLPPGAALAHAMALRRPPVATGGVLLASKEAKRKARQAPPSSPESRRNSREAEEAPIFLSVSACR